ncbi:hypothetical protein ABMA28_012235 [Loxostege sticticalis]|uniref:RING-type domain-containing protein n=1 Tax=Loxostege sticticalis TaxID=481309 RepID=A0ABD0TMB5_LOXSC
MSEPKRKPKSENNKKPKSKITNNNNLANGERPKKRIVMRKSLLDDGIAKSKQLAQKQSTRSSSYGRPKVRNATKNDEVRLCGNGKPMPSLSELERMFDDSDDDEENKVTTPNNTTPSTPKKNPKPNPQEKLMSPTTITEIANKVLDLVSNISDPKELLEDGPPPRLIKPKKRRKPDKPYIVGCKDRPQVPQKPSVKFCKGDDKYGPDSEEISDDDLPKKRAKRGKKVNISKSIFNAKSDEIAARLKECEGESDGSSDSNKTVAYEYYTPINSGRPRSFSPIPSTSKDNETFVKNDQRFNESLISENLSKTNIEDEVEILETPCETIEINDPITYNNTSKYDGSIIEITDDGSTQVFDDKLIASNKTVDINDDDSLQVVDVKPDLNRDLTTDDNCVQVVDKKPASPIVVEDYYSNLDIENIPNDDVCEVIDIDEIIAENKKIIEKYNNTSNLDTVTLVDTSEINKTVGSNYSDKGSDSYLEETVQDSETGENDAATISNINSLTNEQPSVIFVNNEESLSHRPIVENGSQDNNADIEVIDDSNYHPIQSDNRSRNQTDVGSLRNNQPFAPSHRCNCDTERRRMDQQHSHHLSNCTMSYPPQSNPPPRHSTSTTNNDSYQQQLKILTQFFKNRQRNGESRKRPSKKKTPRLSDNILSQHFMSMLQSMTNNMPTANTGSNRIQPSSHVPSPALTPSAVLTPTADTPEKSGKRIGDCPICMDSLSNKPIVSTICGHIFCMDCIKLSIRSNGNKCPTCRKALKKNNGYHQIFL